LPSDHARSSRAADHARAVLVRLVNALGPDAERVVVLGGLAAPTLATTAPVPHEGTTDIDIAVEVAMDYDLEDEDFGWIEAALTRIGAVPARDGGAWQWHVGAVRIDLLCDRYPNEHRGELDLPGAPRCAVMQLAGPAAALRDSRRLLIRDGGEVPVRVAGLGGYLLAKVGAAVDRRLARDYYDFWWVTIHCEGGPESALAAMRGTRLADQLARQRQALAALIGDGSVGGDAAEAYATTMSSLGSTATPDQLIQDVVAAAQLLRPVLNGSGAAPARD